VLANKMVRRIFEPKRGELTGEWRKKYIIRSSMICTARQIFFRLNKSRRMRWAGPVTCMGYRRDLCMVLVGRHIGKRSLVKPRCKWKNYIKTDLQEVEWGYELD